MTFDLRALLCLPDDPATWIARDGVPASAIDIGFPSYESDDGTLLVYETVGFFFQGPDNTPKLFPRSYNRAAAGWDEGLVALHRSARTNRIALIRLSDMERGYGEHAPKCVQEIEWDEPPEGTWRPLVYQGRLDGWGRLGSQQELAWRAGLHEMMMLLVIDRVDDEGEAFERHSMKGAEGRARELLLANLSIQQRLELAATDGFRVRGGQTRRLYRISLGDGFFLLDDSGQVVASYCLHCEYHVPYEDTALATKLALEDPDLEADVLESARTRGPRRTRSATSGERRAAEIERSLIT